MKKQSPVCIVNLDSDLANAMAVNGRVAIKVWRAGGAYFAKAEAPTLDREGRDRLDWMTKGQGGKTEPLLGQKSVMDVQVEGKTVHVVRNILAGCAHMFSTNDEAEA